MKKTRSPYIVLVALNKSLVSRTKKLSGILRACAESGKIELKIMDEGRDLTPDYVDRELRSGVNGFIIGANGIGAAIDHIARLRLPFATISLPRHESGNACQVHTDNAEIGTAAARMLTAQQTYNAYAYYPAADDPDWSRERGEAFLKATAGFRQKPNAVLSRENTAEGLLALPRPVGILAANDTYAAELLDICRKNALRVPKDVAVIGVDNEELLCESTTPALTSIEPDFEREGYEAARAVIQLLTRKRPAARLIRCGIKRTIIRKSTSDERYADALVSRAMEYICEKATDGITVGDVCAHLRVSRRLLGLRFHELGKATPQAAIIDRRLSALKKELVASDQPISVICKRCGFGSENHPKKLFRERFNTTMRDFRAHAKARGKR